VGKVRQLRITTYSQKSQKQSIVNKFSRVIQIQRIKGERFKKKLADNIAMQYT